MYNSKCTNMESKFNYWNCRERCRSTTFSTIIVIFCVWQQYSNHKMWRWISSRGKTRLTGYICSNCIVYVCLNGWSHTYFHVAWKKGPELQRFQRAYRFIVFKWNTLYVCLRIRYDHVLRVTGRINRAQRENASNTSCCCWFLC